MTIENTSAALSGSLVPENENVLPINYVRSTYKYVQRQTPVPSEKVNLSKRILERRCISRFTDPPSVFRLWYPIRTKFWENVEPFEGCAYNETQHYNRNRSLGGYLAYQDNKERANLDIDK